MSTSAVLQAANDLVAAFGSHDTAAYFDSFDASATFVFYNYEGVLADRASYEKLWTLWEGDGFQVLGCTSSNQSVTMLGSEVAVFTHTVRTSLAGEDGPVHTGERETIIFERINGRWLGVHEHLSPDPNFES